MNKLVKFVLLAILLTAALIPLNYFIVEAVLGAKFGTGDYLTYGYFLIVSVFLQRWLIGALSERPQNFVIRFMAAMGIKMFLSLIILIIYLYLNKEGSKIYAVNFVSLYLCYSFFSSYYILKIQRQLKS